MSDTPIRVLIVDDNRIYRDAFRRNLLLNDYLHVVGASKDSCCGAALGISPTTRCRTAWR